MSDTERAATLFASGYNCAQSVFAGMCGTCGIDSKTARSVAAGFGAGMGRLQKTCGAVTGAIMLIGCTYHDETNVAGSKETVYEKTRAFIEEFERTNGSAGCLELLGADFTNPEDMKRVKEQNLFTVKCGKYVRDACEIVKKYL